MSTPTIRPERSFECFSRGLELIRAIRSMWEKNAQLPAGSNAEIDARISRIIEEFDLTVDEWHYWCRHAYASR